MTTDDVCILDDNGNEVSTGSKGIQTLHGLFTWQEWLDRIQNAHKLRLICSQQPVIMTVHSGSVSHGNASHGGRSRSGLLSTLENLSLIREQEQALQSVNSIIDMDSVAKVLPPRLRVCPCVWPSGCDAEDAAEAQLSALQEAT